MSRAHHPTRRTAHVRVVSTSTTLVLTVATSLVALSAAADDGPHQQLGLQGPWYPTGSTGSTLPGEPQSQVLAGDIAPAPQGVVGARGPQGSAGAQGPAGPPGAAGTQGPAGAQGLTGEQGPAGPQGPAGLQGPMGAQGPEGPPGLTGPQGPAGPQGLVGLTGATGLAGAGGVPGATGQTGPQGVQGLQGIQGPPGVLSENSGYFWQSVSGTGTVAQGATVPVGTGQAVVGTAIARASSDSVTLSAGTYLISYYLQAYPDGSDSEKTMSVALSLDGTMIPGSEIQSVTAKNPVLELSMAHTMLVTVTSDGARLRMVNTSLFPLVHVSSSPSAICSSLTVIKLS